MYGRKLFSSSREPGTDRKAAPHGKTSVPPPAQHQSVPPQPNQLGYQSQPVAFSAPGMPVQQSQQAIGNTARPSQANTDRTVPSALLVPQSLGPPRHPIRPNIQTTQPSRAQMLEMFGSTNTVKVDVFFLTAVLDEQKGFALGAGDFQYPTAMSQPVKASNLGKVEEYYHKQRQLSTIPKWSPILNESYKHRGRAWTEAAPGSGISFVFGTPVLQTELPFQPYYVYLAADKYPAKFYYDTVHHRYMEKLDETQQGPRLPLRKLGMYRMAPHVWCVVGFPAGNEYPKLPDLQNGMTRQYWWEIPKGKSRLEVNNPDNLQADWGACEIHDSDGRPRPRQVCWTDMWLETGFMHLDFHGNQFDCFPIKIRRTDHKSDSTQRQKQGSMTESKPVTSRNTQLA